MNIITLTGTVPANSVLPKFEDMFPSLVDPAKIRLIDGFSKADYAVLNGSPFDFANAGQVWSDPGIRFEITHDSDGDYVTSDGSGFATVDLGLSDFRIMTLIEWGAAASFAGIVFRYINANNYWRVSLSNAVGGVLLEKRIDGSNTTMGSYPLSLTVGRKYKLGIQVVDDVIRAAVDDSTFDEIPDTQHAAATLVGINTSNVAHKFFEFVAGGV